MEKIILWGTFAEVQKAYDTLADRIRSGELEVTGAHLTQDAACGDLFDFSFPVIRTGDALFRDASYVLLCGMRSDHAAIASVTNGGVPREKIIPEALLQIPGFSFARYRALSQSRVSILSNCCWGGQTYHFFRLPFLSPTINLFFEDEEYLDFLENLEEMIRTEPELSGTEYNPVDELEYPVFRIGNVKLHMNHCRDSAEGLGKWKERCGRINPDNLLVTMITSQPRAARRFSKLPFARKVCFVPFETEIPCCVHVEPQGRDFVAYINSMATGATGFYDPWTLLEEGRIVRVSSFPEEREDDAHEKLFSAGGLLIYGARSLGHRAYLMLPDRLKEKLCGFAVSSMENNPDEKDGHPVRDLASWAEHFETLNIPGDRILVILALHPQYYREVELALVQNGFRQFLRLEDIERFFSLPIDL